MTNPRIADLTVNEFKDLVHEAVVHLVGGKCGLDQGRESVVVG
jgi:hypothetical protein